jgi:uracil-DNA glycosylase family 4
MCRCKNGRHSALVRPAALLLMGAVAAKALLPAPSRNSGIRKLRGQWQHVILPGMEMPIACLPTYHPAYLARMPSAKRESWHDFIALRQWFSNVDNRP